MNFKKIARKSFIMFTVFIAVLYTLHAFSPYIKESNSSLYVFLNIGYILTLIVYIIIALIWLFINRRIFFILFILFFAGYKNFFSTVAINFPSDFKMEKDSNTLRVMSWNVMDFTILTNPVQTTIYDAFEEINKFNADIVCLQDARDQKGLIPLSKIIAKMKNSFGYKYYYFASYLRTFELTPELYSSYGILFLSKVPLLASKTKLPSSSAFTEYLGYVEISFQSKTMRIYTTHFQSMALWPAEEGSAIPFLHKDSADKSKIKTISNKLTEYKSIHTQQAEFVKAELNKSPYPLIFCGDLNSVPSSYVYHHLREGLNDVFVEKGFGIDGTYNRIAFPKPRIDVMLTSKELKIKQYKRFVIDKKLSDHYPIVADISF